MQRALNKGRKKLNFFFLIKYHFNKIHFSKICQAIVFFFFFFFKYSSEIFVFYIYSDIYIFSYLFIENKKFLTLIFWNPFAERNIFRKFYYSILSISIWKSFERLQWTTWNFFISVSGKCKKKTYVGKYLQ